MARIHRSRTIGKLAAAFAAIVATSRGMYGQSSPMLSLTERARIPLTRQAPLSGAAISADGRVAFWSAVGRRVTEVTRAGQQLELCKDDDLIPVAGTYESGALHIVDARTRRVIVASRASHCAALSDIPLRTISHGVLIAPGRWLLVGLGTSGVAGYYTIDMAEHSARLVEIGTPASRKEQLQTAVPGYLLTEMHWPYRWTERDTLTGLTRKGVPFLSDTLLRSGSDSVSASALLSMPTLLVGRRVIQQLSDPRSDIRVLVSYDESGTRMRVATVNAPIGFLASSTERQELVAMRTSDRSELVVYGWHWSEPPH